MKPDRTDLIICLGVVALIVLIYAQVGRHDFIQYDDPLYVTDNPVVQKGLTLQGVAWAFRHGAEANYWTPLTFLSHMADVQLFGSDAGKHHLTSVAIHAINSVLLYLVLTSITGARWRSAIVAAIWAVHPLHVESVAWIAERKDVLSALFFILAIGAYAKYVRSRSTRWYAVVALLFVLGLMSKPMVMTLPAVLVLMDCWPLKRPARFGALVVEKVPLVALSVACALGTVVAQRASGSMRTLGQFPVGFRLSNAIVSLARYLGKTFWPTDLVVFYPPPVRWPVAVVVLSAAVVLGVTFVALKRRHEQPYLLVGWLWFLGMLVPVIGVLQVGRQAMADRYMYLPHIGLFFAIVWALGDLANKGKALRHCLIVAAAVAIGAFSMTSFVQVRHWQNTETLFTHALLVTENNAVALNQIGNVRARNRDLDDAETLYRQAVGIDPDYALAQQNLGNVLVRQRRFAEAAEHYRAALAGAQPAVAKIKFGLGQALRGMGDFDAAEGTFADALELDPRMAQAHFGWGEMLREHGSLSEAAKHYRAALEIDPNFAMARAALDSLTQSATRRSPASTTTTNTSTKTRK